MNTKILSILVALAFVFSACNKEIPDQIIDEGEVGVKSAVSAFGKIVWNGATDKIVAENIDYVKNDARKNASGPKITSNAHSADFPGIYFIWDWKQKDPGYLKIAAELLEGDGAVFAGYESLTLTTKESNTYWDFTIVKVAGQQKTADNCYVFFIPKVNCKNINMVFVSVATLNVLPYFGTYRVVDFHQHTAYTDGLNPIQFVFNQGVKYGVDVMVNSEHGGAFNRNADFGEQEGDCPTWILSGLKPADIKGDVNGSGDNQNMWRWQSIKEFSFPQVMNFNKKGTGTLAIQGLEWNPPGHEHCSSGIITEQFISKNPNANAMAQFEFMFDANDGDQTGGKEFGWVKSAKSGKEKTMEAAQWLQKNHRFTSWLVPAHPERQNGWNVSDYRNLNDIAPDVFVAFESIPGHQASPNRGGIGNSSSYEKSYTYGGVGIQAAKIGGVWDALISEGRRFWLVANADFHNHVSKGADDFYPGEYQKTYISMKNKTAQGFVDGLRAGNIYTVHGDLIDRLEFSIGSAVMGETYHAKGSAVKVRILVRDPETTNNNTYTSLTNPVLDHIDLIAGELRSKVAQGTAEYSVGAYDKVKVIARFDAKGGVTDANGITSTKWIDLGGGVRLVEYTIPITGDTYFRLRGTNHGLNVKGNTDANGNPLEDMPSATVQEAAKVAFDDLWFYSNPIFVRK